MRVSGDRWCIATAKKNHAAGEETRARKAAAHGGAADSSATDDATGVVPGAVAGGADADPIGAAGDAVDGSMGVLVTGGAVLTGAALALPLARCATDRPGRLSLVTTRCAPSLLKLIKN